MDCPTINSFHNKFSHLVSTDPNISKKKKHLKAVQQQWYASNY